ncbi:ferrichrome-iron receptor [Salmonella enterica]|nr:ferrichrome-iron receptor [Salmonella enterica]
MAFARIIAKPPPPKAVDKNNISARAALLYLFDNSVALYISYSTVFTPTSFANENGNVLES